MKCLMLFGSKSDESTYLKIKNQLEISFEVELEIISAHRDPARLTKRLAQNDYSFIVAGAGLAAHLPGVCASLTDLPVFGIPVNGCFGGLDALLSIQQMPFGVPVASFGVENWSQIFILNSKIKEVVKNNSTRTINIIIPKDLENEIYIKKELERTYGYATDLNMEITCSHSHREDVFNIYLVTKEEELLKRSDSFYVPLLNTPDKANPASAIWLLDEVNRGGLWFGVNNTRNAICFYRKLIEFWR